MHASGPYGVPRQWVCLPSGLEGRFEGLRLDTIGPGLRVCQGVSTKFLSAADGVTVKSALYASCCWGGHLDVPTVAP